MCDQTQCKPHCERRKSSYEYTYEVIEQIAQHLKKTVKKGPQVGIICGSGLGSISNIVSITHSIDYKDIPNFPVSTVEGHEGKLLFGFIRNVPVVCMLGRFHFYEGYSLSTCTMPVRLMKLLGVTTLILSNAAGGINSGFEVGDIMLIKDHINLVGFAGMNPLRGRNEDKLGPRFVALNNAYDPKIIKQAKELGAKLGLEGLQEGVYCCVGGPNYETTAELRALRTLGADAVGMSTVHEIITAKHCDLRCFAFSLITNACVMEYGGTEKPNHEEIVTAANKKMKDLVKFIEELVPHLSN